MIEVEDLHESYGELTAVAGVGFTAEPGLVFGLLGPNGAGKSTTIGCISGLVAPSSGRVLVMGHDVVKDGTRARARRSGSCRRSWRCTRTSRPPTTWPIGVRPTAWRAASCGGAWARCSS